MPEAIDWECNVRRDYAEHNLGCRMRVSSGLDWVFQHVEDAIILEVDCATHPTFFPFAEELPERYGHDERIMGIGGSNLQRRKRDERSCCYKRAATSRHIAQTLVLSNPVAVLNLAAQVSRCPGSSNES